MHKPPSQISPSPSKGPEKIGPWGGGGGRERGTCILERNKVFKQKQLSKNNFRELYSVNY